jgi:ribosomal-protein-alanine N-acetyltransferase
MLRTARLLLREWRDSDLDAFAAMNADARVMEHFPATLSREESARGAERIRAHFEAHGFGLWALELPGEIAFAGFVGIAEPTFAAHFMPCVELGWRLAYDAWGKGYATEAARAVMRDGFERVGLDEIVSTTVPANVRSQRVMQKLGMLRSPLDDFDHPRIPEGHVLQRHVLYRIRRDAWRTMGYGRPPDDA